MLIPLFLMLVPVSSTGTTNFERSLPASLQDEVHMTVPEIITKYKYESETHSVVTEDGYILTMHRILPKGKNQKGTVFLMHGIIASSADWIITGPDHAFAYLLADEGYDVWLGNARGNRYSRNHTRLNPDSKEFWDFSWHEIGKYDLPAMIDYVTDLTQQKVFYIAHSQGTTVFYVMCSLKPKYNEKIRAQLSLSPVAFLDHIFSPIFRLLAHETGFLESTAEFLHLEELLPKGGVVSILGEKICGLNEITEVLCSNALFAICGFNPKQLNTTLLPLILSHVPAGSSVKQVLHFAQEIRSGQFRQFDKGFFNNMRSYRQLSPPQYNLKYVKVPVYIFYGTNDWISTPIDVFRLKNALPNVKGAFRVADSGFNHMDFMFGIQARTMVYNKVLSLLTRH